MEKGERYQADLDTSHQFSSRQVSPFQFENRTIHPRYKTISRLPETQLTSNNIQEL